MTNGQFLEGLKIFEPHLDSKSNTISADSDTIFVPLRAGLRDLGMPETIKRLLDLGWELDLEYDNGTQYKYWKGSL